MKYVKRFRVKGMLAPHYIGQFSILEKCGTVAYKLDLPLSLAGVHDIFHMSQLKKGLKAHVDVMLPKVTLLEADLSYLEYPIKILNRKDHVTRCKAIKFFKIQWSNHTEEEATWESEGFLRSRKQPGKARTFFVLAIQTLCYHSEENVQLFAGPVRTATPSKSQGEISVRREDCDTPSVTLVATMFKQ
jgi:hypothetical protein